MDITTAFVLAGLTIAFVLFPPSTWGRGGRRARARTPETIRKELRRERLKLTCSLAAEGRAYYEERDLRGECRTKITLLLQEMKQRGIEELPEDRGPVL